MGEKLLPGLGETIKNQMKGVRTPTAFLRERLEDDLIYSGPMGIRLKEGGVPVWAIIGNATGSETTIEEISQAYQVSKESIIAALGYYRRPRNRWLIDARRTANLTLESF